MFATRMWQRTKSGRVRRVLLISVLLAGMTCGVSSAIEPSDVELLLANEKAWAKAPVDGDADRMASFMADEYLELVGEPATPTMAARWTATTKETWVQRVRRHTEVYSAVELKNLTVQLQGSMAVVTGEYSQVGTNDGKDNTSSGIYTDTWVKRKGCWLVIQSVFP
jgi:ketosteroid isomerase-like protein